MKLKEREIAKLVLLCAGVLLACDAIYYFVDNVCNGVFADWFMENYIYESESVYMGEKILVREPYWLGIKSLLFQTMCALAVILTVVVFAVSYFYARAREKQTTAQICREIRDYMQKEGEGPGIFSKEHAEVFAQMSEIRAVMQRHEQILQEEAARKNDLITYLAHDLKTPLTSVIGYLSLLDEAADMPEPQRAKYVRVALDKAQRLEKLINEFFEITRYNLQQVELEEEMIDLSYMLVQMTDEFYPLLQAHGNTVNLRAEEGAAVYGDPDRLARVFNNILKNAIAYSYPGTVIDVWTQTEPGEVQIYFRNRGKTIPEKKLDSIFEKFFRLDEARASNTGGAGLGLAIAKEIVALHRGTLTAKSEEELTTFCVALPSPER